MTPACKEGGLKECAYVHVCGIKEPYLNLSLGYSQVLKSQNDSQMLGLWSYLMQNQKKEYSWFGFDLAHVIEVPIASDPTGRSKDFL